ncbi:MAG: DUF1848 domain-containing protein [Firmicutes bacterium]|nr:DUF1848 domain-containing protein [Bacillota bacterium]
MSPAGRERKSGYLPVLTVSRRTDMVRWYPQDLLRILARRYPPERVHTVLVLTKFPRALLWEPLRRTLSAYEQVVVHVTVTGLGGTELEPRVPPAEDSLAALSEVVALAGCPERVALRIDPIVHWRRAGSDGPVFTNLPLFGGLARQARASGVTLVKTSLASPYRKAQRRFAAHGMELVTLEREERLDALRYLEREAELAGVRLEFCCEPLRPTSACVDAGLLTRLHPRGLPARPDRATGQRPICGCAHAVDLAWYSSHPCPSGCLYCYANPLERA